jgi:hypothetical protein
LERNEVSPKNSFQSKCHFMHENDSSSSSSCSCLYAYRLSTYDGSRMKTISSLNQWMISLVRLF